MVMIVAQVNNFNLRIKVLRVNLQF
jgi:hypothetical protein